MRLADRQVDQPVVRAVADHLAEERACDRSDRLLAQTRQHGLIEQPRDRLVAQPVQRGDGDADDLVGRPAGVRGHERPGGGPFGDPSGQHPVADDVLAQEVVAHEVLQAASEGVLLLGDEGGVRDRQPEWVPEQRSHGEPVGHGADHRGLGAGVDKPQTPSLPNVRT